ncbi:MAG TPA: hypothetical protein VF590_05285 [Isosphaeraceae bacterium]|jgi:hypothetical protein
MKRRVLRLEWIVVGAGMILAGCQSLHPLGLRPRDDPSAGQPIAPTESSNPETALAEKIQGLHKPSRLRGALSSEGAEVERHLGIQ